MINKFLDTRFLSSFKSVIDKFYKWIIAWTKEWVFRQIYNTVIITDDNWDTYISPEGDYNKSSSSGKMIRNSNSLSTFSTIENAKADIKVNTTNLWTAYLFTIRLNKSVRRLQFKANHFNFVGLTILPPEYDPNDLTKNNGYKLSLFIEPSYGKIDYYSKTEYSYTSYGVEIIKPRHTSIGINTDEDSGNAWYGGLYKNQFSESTSPDYCLPIFNGESSTNYIVKNPYSDINKYINEFDYEEISTSENNTTNRRNECIIKPGRVIELMWFNGFWYIMGPR